jgi:ferric-dicitrate binding protein FerR (iron transport regulator)
MTPELLDRYLAGEANAAEQQVVEAWMRADAARRDLIAGLRRSDCADVEGWLRRVRKKIVDGEREVRGRALPGSVMIPKWRHLVFSGRALARENVVRPGGGRMGGLGTQTLRGWMWPTSTVAALVAIMFIVRLGSPHVSRTTRSYATGVNQQGIVTLDDGTRVTLAPQSMLRLLDFGTQHRTVAVDGKAYFEVARASGAPFEVRSGSVTARVLGTAFFVDHALRSSRVRIAVEDGKLRVLVPSRANAGFTVTAGYVGEFSDSSATVDAIVDSISGTEWLRGKLVFHHMPVSTVLQTLNRWYGYQFLCADSTLPQRNVTIVLSVRSPSSALATLEQILRVNLSMTGDTVTLTPHPDGRGKGVPNVRSYDLWTPTREVGR